MTFKEMQDDVLYRLDNQDSTLRTYVKTWLNSAQREFCSDYDFPFLEASTTIPTVASTESYSLPSDYWKIYQIYQTTSPNRLRYISRAEFKKYFPNATNEASPWAYSLFANQIHFYPIPNAVITMYLDYLRTPTSMSADGDTGSIPENFQEALVCWAASRGKKQDDEDRQGDFYKFEFERIKEEAKMFYQKKEKEHDRLGNADESTISWQSRVDLPITEPS